MRDLELSGYSRRGSRSGCATTAPAAESVRGEGTARHGGRQAHLRGIRSKGSNRERIRPAEARRRRRRRSKGPQAERRNRGPGMAKSSGIHPRRADLKKKMDGAAHSGIFAALSLLLEGRCAIYNHQVRRARNRTESMRTRPIAAVRGSTARQEAAMAPAASSKAAGASCACTRTRGGTRGQARDEAGRRRAAAERSGAAWKIRHEERLPGSWWLAAKI